jgi:hypothetical protein
MCTFTPRTADLVLSPRARPSDLFRVKATGRMAGTPASKQRNPPASYESQRTYHAASSDSLALSAHDSMKKKLGVESQYKPDVMLITTDAAPRGLTPGLGSVSVVTVGATTAQS